MEMDMQGKIVVYHEHTDLKLTKVVQSKRNTSDEF